MTNALKAQASDEPRRVNSQEKEGDNLRKMQEDLRACRRQDWFDWVLFAMITGVILVTALGFGAFAYQIVAKQLIWIQVAGLLGLSLLWLCLVAVVISSLGRRKR